MTAPRSQRARLSAFSLVELLTVIAIIAVLMSIIISATGSAKEAAKRVQAKHDVRDLVTAVNAYYAEYGVYPLDPKTAQEATEVTFTTDNSALIRPLTADPKGVNMDNVLNPQRVVYLEVAQVKDPNFPRNGICNGIWYDGWGPQAGKPESGIYHVRLDGTYSNQVSDPYPGDQHDDGDKDGDSDGGKGDAKWGGGGGSSKAKATIPLGVISWSLAKTGIQTYELRDQVLSWK